MKASPAPTSTADKDRDATPTPFDPLDDLVQALPLQVPPMRGALVPDVAAIGLPRIELELFPWTVSLVESSLLALEADFV